MTDNEAVVETLRAARKLIENERDWTQRRMIRVTYPWWSVFLGPFGRERVQYCAMGAVSKIDGPYEREATGLLALAVSAECGMPLRPGMHFADWMARVTYFNDNYTHAEVLEIFDAAIVLAAKQEVTV